MLALTSEVGATPQPGTYVGVTELESWYPQAQAVRLVNRNSGLDLGVSGASTALGAAVVQQTADGSANQRWQLEPAQNGYYKIVNVGSGLLLGISNASTAPGADALQWTDNGTTDHLWTLAPAS